MLLFALMLAGLVMSASIPRGVRGSARWPFALAFVPHADRARPVHAVGAQAPRRPQLSATSCASRSGTSRPRRSGSPAAWSPIDVAPARVLGAGVGIESLAPHRSDSGCRGLGRRAPRTGRSKARTSRERCGLFVIIALGESILITGAIVRRPGLDPASRSPHSWCAFAGSVAMWAVYFNIGAERSSRHIEPLDRSRHAGAQRLHVYSYPDRRRHHRRSGRRRAACCDHPGGHDGHTGIGARPARSSAARRSIWSATRCSSGLSARQHAAVRIVAGHAARGRARAVRSMITDTAGALGRHDRQF